MCVLCQEWETEGSILFCPMHWLKTFYGLSYTLSYNIILSIHRSRYSLSLSRLWLCSHTTSNVASPSQQQGLKLCQALLIDIGAWLMAQTIVTRCLNKQLGEWARQWSWQLLVGIMVVSRGRPLLVCHRNPWCASLPTAIEAQNWVHSYKC